MSRLPAADGRGRFAPAFLGSIDQDHTRPHSLRILYHSEARYTGTSVHPISGCLWRLRIRNFGIPAFRHTPRLRLRDLHNTMGLNFDRSKAYAPQEKDTFYDDGREIELLHFVYSHPRLDHIRGSPSGVLAAIDEYARTKKYLMNVGQDKGRIVSNLIRDVKPKIMVSST